MVAIGPQMQALLQQYNLGELAEWLSNQIVQNRSEEEIMLLLYDRPEFKKIYPEIDARRQRAVREGITVTPISVDDVMNYRAQARQLMQGYGVPPQVWHKNSSFFDLIVNDVSIDELAQRLDITEQRVRSAPPEVRQVFDSLFGTAGGGDSALFALAVDVNKTLPALDEMIQRAEAGGAARRMGFELTPAETERLAGVNLSYNQFLEGFSLLDAQRSLFDETIAEEGEDYTATEEGTAAVFGLEAGAQGKINKRAEERVSSTKGHGGGLIEERGATGLGGAGRR